MYLQKLQAVLEWPRISADSRDSDAVLVYVKTAAIHYQYLLEINFIQGWTHQNNMEWRARIITKYLCFHQARPKYILALAREN